MYNKSEITYATGLWNLDREGRKFDEWYLPVFEQLLTVNISMFIFVPKELEQWVRERRKSHNTHIKVYELEDIRKFYDPHWENTQNIRQDPDWYNQAEWLKTSPQAVLEYYNPIVMSKLPMLHDVSLADPFNSRFFYWIDAGICKYVSVDLLKSGILNRVGYEAFTFLSYPHEIDDEIHGFEREAIADYCGVDFVRYVCRGGFFGGNKFLLSMINAEYYHLTEQTLRAGYMGTEESIFTILSYRFPELLGRFDLGGGGYGPYFEWLTTRKNVNMVSLYVLSYNAPKQFQCLIESFEICDKNFLIEPDLYLIDNSDDLQVEAEYQVICEKYGFTRIKKDNNYARANYYVRRDCFHDPVWFCFYPTFTRITYESYRNYISHSF